MRKKQKSFIKVLGITGLMLLVGVVIFYIIAFSNFKTATRDVVNAVSKQVVRWERDSINVIDTIYNALEDAHTDSKTDSIDTRKDE